MGNNKKRAKSAAENPIIIIAVLGTGCNHADCELCCCESQQD